MIKKQIYRTNNQLEAKQLVGLENGPPWFDNSQRFFADLQKLNKKGDS